VVQRCRTSQLKPPIGRLRKSARQQTAALTEVIQNGRCGVVIQLDFQHVVQRSRIELKYLHGKTGSARFYLRPKWDSQCSNIGGERRDMCVALTWQMEVL
jgi:hypothetical protein